MAVRQTKSGLFVLRTMTKGRRIPSGYIRVQLSKEPRAGGESITWWETMALEQYQNLQPRLVSRRLFTGITLGEST